MTPQTVITAKDAPATSEALATPPGPPPVGALPMAEPVGLTHYFASTQRRLAWRRPGDGDRTMFTVTDRGTGVFGAGPTPFDALQDFTRARREHREVLEAEPKLSPDLKRQLKLLRG